MAGIDLGTSNSSIAMIRDGAPHVIRPNRLDEVLPSVVFIDRGGEVLVGRQARECMLTLDERQGTGQDRWKPRMGQDDCYQFHAADQTKTASELSALVIRELLKAYRREAGEELSHCVITIPAKFDQPANDATRAAARLAGLQFAPTLKEPIAAALAYGFTRQDQRANWMVFDLGGGTLDVSIMVVRRGDLAVLKDGQGGDQDLGGSNFDRELLDFVLGPVSDVSAKWDRYGKLQAEYTPLRRQYRLDGFSRKTHRTAWHQLMLAVEEAKIELSRKTETEVYLDDPLCRDEAGRPVEVRVPVTRAAYEALIAPDIERAVHICQTLLAKNRMTAKDLDQLILIGGPTKTPFLQQVLSDRLKVDLDIRIDPMTAVAQGAALHSETVEPPNGRSVLPVRTHADLELRLDAPPSSKQPTCTVAGVLSGNDVQPDLTIEIQRDDEGWASGQVPIDDTGFFACDVLLAEKGRPYQSSFTTSVRDRYGKLLATVSKPRVWYPLPTAKPTLTNSIGVALAGNETLVLLEQGVTLKARSKAVVQTVKPVRRGSADDLLRIPVIEAVTSLLGTEDRVHADAYVKIGELSVGGDHERVTCDLPKGSKVELSVDVGESQQITVVAYVERFEDEFQAQLEIKPEVPSVEELQQRHQAEQERWSQVCHLHKIAPQPLVAEAIEAVERLHELETIQTELDRQQAGEASVGLRALKRILGLAGTINQCREVQRYVRLEEQLSQIRKGAKAEERPEISKLHEALEAAGPDAPAETLMPLETEISNLDIKIRHRPFYTLLVYTSALCGLRVSHHQHQVHTEATELGDRLIKQGAPNNLTKSDFDRIETMNQKLRDAYPDLYEHVRTWEQNNLNLGSLVDSFGSTVARTR